jgi:hypothetical protein
MPAVLELPTVHVRPPMVYVEPAWEYKHVTQPLSPGMDDSELALLGNLGWELVSVLNDGQTAHYYFKRQAR